jgi:maltose alpha-D-glucosyltransferase/alpha-amylase
VVVALTNLAAEPCTVDIERREGEREPVSIFGNRDYGPPPADLHGLDLDGYGYRWLRLRHDVGWSGLQ